jgi:hypothetical protein
VAARSKAWTVLARSNTEIVDSNPTGGMDVCMRLFCVCDRFCGLVVRVPGYRSRGPGSISGATRFFREVVDLERGPRRSVSTIEELLGRNSSGFGVENRNYGRRDPPCWPRDTPLCPQKLSLTSLTSGDCSVGIVRSRLSPRSFFFCLFFVCVVLCVGSALATGWAPDQGVLPTVCKKIASPVTGCGGL